MSVNGADSVRVEWTGTGTGTMALGGVVAGYQGFPPSLDQLQVSYLIEHQDEGVVERENGRGIYDQAANSLSRDEITFSTNGNAPVDFSVGKKHVVLTLLFEDLASDTSFSVQQAQIDLTDGSGVQAEQNTYVVQIENAGFFVTNRLINDSAPTPPTADLTIIMPAAPAIGEYYFFYSPAEQTGTVKIQVAPGLGHLIRPGNLTEIELAPGSAFGWLYCEQDATTGAVRYQYRGQFNQPASWPTPITFEQGVTIASGMPLSVGGNATVGGTLGVTGLATAQAGVTMSGGVADFAGNIAKGNISEVLSTVSGALTRAAHSGRGLRLSGNVTVPNAAADVGAHYQMRSEAGGETIAFNSTTSDPMAVGETVSVYVWATNIIEAVGTESGRLAFS